MRLVYRNAIVSDIPILVDLLDALGYTVTAAELPSRLASIASRGGTVIVADLDGAVIGAVMAFTDVRLAEGESGEIATLVVAPSHRGMGVGNRLVAEAQRWLQAAGCRRIRVRANAIRTDAHRFYRNLGFKEVKTQLVLSMQIGADHNSQSEIP